VIIPAYNAASTIERTLASLRDQSFGDFEALVVDDGSTDATAEAVTRATAGDGRFRLIRQANAGVAVARNRGLAEARGPYLANLDADDLWRPPFLDRCVRALEAAGETAVLAFARSAWIGPDDAALPVSDRRLPAIVGYRELLLRNPIGNGSAAVMRTETVRAIGGWSADLVRDRGPAEDWLLQMQLSWRGQVIPIDEGLVLYRVSPDSASQALERAAKGALEVIHRCQADGPRLPRAVYWDARSLTMLWLLRRARAAGRRGLAARLAFHAYLRNPLWFRLADLRAPLQRASPRRRSGHDPVPRGEGARRYALEGGDEGSPGVL
jgi:glycosyltransferase involved in cell wall biosynthesis